MEDVDITLQPRKLFKDNPPLRLSDNISYAEPEAVGLRLERAVVQAVFTKPDLKID